MDNLNEKFNLITENLEKNLEIDKKIMDIETQLKNNQNLMEKYSLKLHTMKKQVEELKQLNQTLVHDCYSKITFKTEQ